MHSTKNLRWVLPLLWAWAPLLHAETSGYVVNVDSDTVYLDAGSGAAAAGREFVIYAEGKELKHPVTGASLGKIEKELARGRIEEVKPQYSVGHILSRGAQAGAADLHPGIRYKLVITAAPPSAQNPASSSPEARVPAQFPNPSSPQPSPLSQGPFRTPTWRSPAADMEAMGMATADLLGDGRSEILLIDDRRLTAYPNGWGEWKSLCAFEDKTANIKNLSVDAMDLDQNGKAEAFVTHHNVFFNRVETAVFECRDGTFAKLATLPWMTRAYPDASGVWRLASQQLMGDATFPFANIYPLEFKEGRYVQSGEPLHLQRVDWVYGFAMAQDPGIGAPFHLFYSNTDSIRIQFKKGNWLTPESYGQTSSRIRWYERFLLFRPHLIATQSNGIFTGVYTLRNNPGLGGLAGAFGYYNTAELHRLKWNGLSLDPEWRADLGGYAADAALVRGDASRPDELLVAVVGKGGKTSVWKFQP